MKFIRNETGDHPAFDNQHFSFRMDIFIGDKPPWFDLKKQNPEILRQRIKIHKTQPERSLLYLPDADEFLPEIGELFGISGLKGKAGLLELSTQVESDIVIMKKNPDGEPIMVGGAVCFPSSWKPEEKLGLPVSQIHAPSPGLNEAIGEKIAKFLNRLRPDQLYERLNWGLAATDQLDMHPDEDFPPLSADSGFEEIYLRIEHQAFQALEKSPAVVFLINLFIIPLSQALGDKENQQAFRLLIESMDPKVLAYKNISPVKSTLLENLTT